MNSTNLDFESFFTGQLVAKFRLPGVYVDRLNLRLDEVINRGEQIFVNQYLAGKIKAEIHALDLLDEDLLAYFYHVARAYLGAVKTFAGKLDIERINISSCWFNDQREKEYNPVHTHRGESPIGINTVLFLKVPDNFGQEFVVDEEWPTNGHLHLLVNRGGMFSRNNQRVKPVVGDLWMFPYDLQHTVYPFFGEGVRRSLSYNCDVYLTKLV